MPRSPGSFSAALAPIVPFQLGASFVFAPGDRDLYVHLSGTFGDNAPVGELVAAVAAGDGER